MGLVDFQAEAKIYRYYSSVFGSGCSSTTYTGGASEDGTAFNIEGKVRTKPAGTTDWTVDTAYFGFDLLYSTSFTTSFRGAHIVNRNGFNVEPGCGIPASVSSFLPSRLIGYNATGITIPPKTYSYGAGSVLWYPGELTYTPNYTSSSTAIGSSCYENYHYGMIQATWAPIGTGDTHSHSL